MERKVANIGIRLWQGFSAHQFGGLPRNRGIAGSELASRTGEGRGTTIRSTLLAEYQHEREGLRADARAIKGRQWMGLQSSKNAKLEKANRAARVSLWQSIVGREVKARQSGIGELGAAFGNVLPSLPAHRPDAVTGEDPDETGDRWRHTLYFDRWGRSVGATDCSYFGLLNGTDAYTMAGWVPTRQE